MADCLAVPRLRDGPGPVACHDRAEQQPIREPGRRHLNMADPAPRREPLCARRCLLTGSGWLLATAVAVAPAARAQEADQGGGSFSQTLVPGVGSSLMQSGPAQPGGFGGGTGNMLPGLPGQTFGDRVNTGLGLLAAGQPAPQAVQYGAAINVQQGWTDNAFDMPGVAPQSAFFTMVNPSISASVDTQRVQGSLSYAPSIVEYEPNNGLSTVAQNLTGQAHAILVPDTLFVDLSAFGGVQTIAGGYGPSNTVVPNNINTAQDYAFSVSPYLQHRFGGLGVGEIGVAFSTSGQLVPGGIVAAPQPGLPPMAIGNQIMTSTQEHVALRSGEDFGRWLSAFYASATQFGGSGVFVGGYDNTVSYEAGYAITHNVTALATIGWEDLSYSGVPPLHISQPLWNVGVQLTPNPNSNIVVRYGRQDGYTSAFVNGTYAPTGHLMFTANYSVTISTDQQQLGSDLLNATSDPFGNPVNVQTGQPLLQNNNFLGMFAGVYKLETAALTASLVRDRDTFQISLNQEQETPLSTFPGGILYGPMTGTFGTLTWSHDLSEPVKTSLQAMYGVNQASFGGASFNSTTFVGTATISYAISPSFNVSLQYTRMVNRYAAALPGFASDTVIAGASKSF